MEKTLTHLISQIGQKWMPRGIQLQMPFGDMSWFWFFLIFIILFHGLSYVMQHGVMGCDDGMMEIIYNCV